MINTNKSLPIYLQRNIIIKLCEYINKCIKNKGVFNQVEYIEIKIEIKKLIIMLSMVNKEWFKTVSNNLNIIDFDDQERKIMEYSGGGNEYSLFKIENCKYLKIIPWNTINVSILVEKLTNGSFSSLKILIIQESVEKVDRIYQFIDELRNNKLTIDIHLEAFDLTTNGMGNEQYINNLIDCNVKKVYCIKFFQYENELVILKVFSTWLNSIKKIIYAGLKKNLLNIFQVLSPRQETDNINYLENIQSIAIYKSYGLPLDTIISSLKHAHKLKELSISLCFKALIYNLSTTEERKSLSMSTCEICSFIGDIEIPQKVEQWYILCELFKSNNTLKHFTIDGTCNKFEIKYQKLVLEISNLVSSIVSLDKFSLKSRNYPEIFKSIVENNKSITKFYSSIYSNNELSNIDQERENNSMSIFNDLIQSNPHITNFDFESCTYKTKPYKKILINFNKS